MVVRLLVVLKVFIDSPCCGVRRDSNFASNAEDDGGLKLNVTLGEHVQKRFTRVKRSELSSYRGHERIFLEEARDLKDYPCFPVPARLPALLNRQRANQLLKRHKADQSLSDSSTKLICQV